MAHSSHIAPSGVGLHPKRMSECSGGGGLQKDEYCTEAVGPHEAVWAAVLRDGRHITTVILMEACCRVRGW